MGLMADYLLDTNVLIAWFGKCEGYGILQSLLERSDSRFFTSVLCAAEFLAGCAPNDARALRNIVESSEVVIIPFDNLTQAESAARLRKSLGLKMPDAIIASAAKENNLILCTLDKDFAVKAAAEIKIYFAT